LENQQKIEELSQKVEEMRRLIIEKDAKSYSYFESEINKLIEVKLNLALAENLNAINRQISYLERGMCILLPVVKLTLKVRDFKKRLFR